MYPLPLTQFSKDKIHVHKTILKKKPNTKHFPKNNCHQSLAVCRSHMSGHQEHPAAPLRPASETSGGLVAVAIH